MKIEKYLNETYIDPDDFDVESDVFMEQLKSISDKIKKLNPQQVEKYIKKYYKSYPGIKKTVELLDTFLSKI